MATQNYNCTEQELYTICETAWNSCRQHLPGFTAFKPKYTDPFIDSRLDDIKTARELPDEQQRNEAYETANIQLRKDGRKACDLWQYLKRYIADAYPSDLHKPKWEAAGYNYYVKASNNNWDSVKGLMTSGLTFINSNMADLTANDNMPLSFKSDFEGAKNDFEKTHQKFIQAEEDSHTGQDKKMTANNALHTDLMSMLLDGQEIYKNEEPIYKQFVFTELLYLASGAGTAGFKGQVTAVGSQLGLQEVTVTIKDNSKTAVTDAEGKYEIHQLASGKYTITFAKEGYEPKIIVDFTVKVGTVSNLNIELIPLP